MEVSNILNDGTTDIIKKIYKDNNIFNENYLDISLTFGYIKENDKWTMIECEKLEKYRKDNKKEILIYYIDFNGLTDEIVSKDKVISFSIMYQ